MSIKTLFNLIKLTNKVRTTNFLETREVRRGRARDGDTANVLQVACGWLIVRRAVHFAFGLWLFSTTPAERRNEEINLPLMPSSSRSGAQRSGGRRDTGTTSGRRGGGAVTAIVEGVGSEDVFKSSADFAMAGRERVTGK